MTINYLNNNEITQIHYAVMEKDEDINILHPNQLKYTLDRIQWSHYSRDEDFFDKCAILFRDIVSGHIFVDGNKRTGFASLHLFLRKNGYEIKTSFEVTSNEKSLFKKLKDILVEYFKKILPKSSERHFSFIWQFVLRVASEEVPLTEIREWIIKISKKIK